MGNRGWRETTIYFLHACRYVVNSFQASDHLLVFASLEAILSSERAIGLTSMTLVVGSFLQPMRNAPLLAVFQSDACPFHIISNLKAKVVSWQQRSAISGNRILRLKPCWTKGVFEAKNSNLESW